MAYSYLRPKNNVLYGFPELIQVASVITNAGECFKAKALYHLSLP